MEAQMSRLGDRALPRKACEFHRNISCIVLGGQRMRFCHQCQRFERLADFDVAKRRASL